MSRWKEIMEEAERAKWKMIQNSKEGGIEFENLLAKYPYDGMVYFKRGGAYKECGKIEKADADFLQASKLFPLEEWRKRALDEMSGIRKDY